MTFYPLDTQTCILSLTTVSYTMDDIRLIETDSATDMSGFTEKWRMGYLFNNDH